jgi:hypothetical protein
MSHVENVQKSDSGQESVNFATLRPVFDMIDSTHFLKQNVSNGRTTTSIGATCYLFDLRYNNE